MLTTVLTALIAVLGTLAGAGLNGHFQARTAKAQRLETNQREKEKEVKKSVVALVVALDKHRGVMWAAEKRRLVSGSKDIDNDETRVSRAAVSEPLAELCLAAESLADLAREAAFHTFAMRGCPTEEELDIRRMRAHTATTKFVDAAAAQFKAAGIGLALPAVSSNGS